MSGTGTVVVNIVAGAARDAAGNPNLASAGGDNSVQFDGVNPTVSINRSAGQSDPATGGPITFDVIFSEPVSGFDRTAISLAGSTVGGSLIANVTELTPSTYTVEVTGMSGAGTVVASIPAATAVDAAGNPNLASTSSDNVVDYNGVGSVGFTTVKTDTAVNSTVTVFVRRTGGSDGPVSIDYTVGGGTATAGDDYTVVGGATGTLSWAAGETGDKPIVINILDDGRSSGPETIPLSLGTPTGLAQAGLMNSTVVIGKIHPRTITAKSRSLRFTDSDGDLVTVKFGGKIGSADVYLTDSHGPISVVDLAGTDPRTTSVTISVVKPRHGTGDGLVGLGELHGSGLRLLNARFADLDGAGINFNGYLGSVTVHGVKNGADIVTTGGFPAQRTLLSLGVVQDGTVIDLANAISSLTATSFGRGAISAPAIGSIRTRGRSSNHKTGDLGDPGDSKADVTISGVGVPAGKAALGSLRVKGNILGSRILVDGRVNELSALGFRDSRLFAGYTGADDGSGTFDPVGSIGSFQVRAAADGFANSHVIASSIRNVSLSSVDADNDRTEFGFVADVSIGRVKVKSPAFSFVPRIDGTSKVLGDFEVKVV
jgi:hypothetical protein